MRTSLRRDLTSALKNRDHIAVAALRSALAAIENAEAPPVDQSSTAGGEGPIAGAAAGVGAAESNRRNLTEADIHTIVTREVSERSATAEQYDRLGRDDMAERLRAEADVLSRYLVAGH